MSTSVVLAVAFLQLAVVVELALIVHLLRQLRRAREELLESRHVIELDRESERGSDSRRQAGLG